MAWTNPDGWTYALTNYARNIHRTKTVTAMSRFKAGSTKSTIPKHAGNLRI